MTGAHEAVLAVQPITSAMRAGHHLPAAAALVLTETYQGHEAVISTDLDCPLGILTAARAWAEATGAAYQAPPAVPVLLPRPTQHLGLTALSVTPGLVDDHARELFLYSQCHILALHLHELTGWPLWAGEQLLPDGEWRWVHLAVRTPDGQWLDIEGPRAAQDVTAWLSGWGLPVRLRLLGGLDEWHTMTGHAPGTPVTWWRTTTDATGAALVEAFARVVLAACATRQATPLAGAS